jgi:hypothetical protein
MKKSFAVFIACICLVQPSVARQGQVQPPTTPTKDQRQPLAPTKDRTPETHSFLTWLAQVSGLSATSSGLRGTDGDYEGDIWEQPVGGGTLRRLTSEGGYSWPVFSPDDRQVIALRGGDLWSLPANGGRPSKLARGPAGVVSLVGSGPDGLVMLTTEAIGILSLKSAVFSPFQPASPEDRTDIARMRSPARSYDHGQLTVSERMGVVLVDRGGQIREVASEHAASRQPSVSHDLKRLVFVSAPDAVR